MSPLQAMTQKIIRKAIGNVSFAARQQMPFRVCAEYPKNILYGQAFCTVRYDAEGQELVEVIEKMQAYRECPYLAIRVNVGMFNGEAERLLIDRGFLPTSFLPYFDDGDDIIEYQYIGTEKQNLLSEYLPNREELRAYLQRR